MRETPIESGIECVTGTELHFRVRNSDGLSRFHDDDFRLWHVRILLLTTLNHDRSQVPRVERRIAETSHKEWDAADVVKVSVRDDNGANALPVLLKVRSIRQRVVGTRRILFFFEVETRVHYDNVAIYINSDHIAADLFNAAQWNDAHDIF